MSELKLISVRIDKDVLRKVDGLAAQSGIMKRSWIINNLLAACVTCADSGTLFKLASTFEPKKRGFKLSYRIDPTELENTKDYND